MSVEWSWFNQFDWADEKYLPQSGEGDTMATQIVTAVTKLVYKWYNDGDVYDNRYALDGWYNDLSSYANWLVKNTAVCGMLYDIEHEEEILSGGDYEDMLKELVLATHDPKYLEEMDKLPKVGSIYDCDGPFKFIDFDEDEDEY